eukprot:TRINITY_DN39593_c0_g1_i1.p1 TRINITY_DN39593_c0_g1~~TRINITY_DN39593_c0_g1_i1.p1  ORF type:complete len:285 (-),score=25.57 TRINITY_DN39593_c0_g1_i1:367-1167(-)
MALMEKVRGAPRSNSVMCAYCPACKGSHEMCRLACGHCLCHGCLRHYIRRLDYFRTAAGCPCGRGPLSADQIRQLVGVEEFAAREALTRSAHSSNVQGLGQTISQRQSFEPPMRKREPDPIGAHASQASQAQRPHQERPVSQSVGSKAAEVESDAELARRLQESLDMDDQAANSKSSEQKRQEEKDAERMFEEFLAREQLKRCPVCKAPSERKEGSCNFLQCRSDICRKRTYWCFLCGDRKTLEEHYSHYPKGPYVDVCYGMQGAS